MKVVAIMPIKLKNERCPGKNLRMLGNKPLLQHELDNLKQTGLCDSINVFCSDEAIVHFLPQGVNFIKRSESLDLPTKNFTQILKISWRLWMQIFMYMPMQQRHLLQYQQCNNVLRL